MSSYAAPSELSAIGMEMVFNPRYGLRALATPYVAPIFDYYLSPTGSDSNPGTLAAPFAITSLTTASPNYSKIAGNTIGLLNGTYDVSTLAGDTYSVKLTIPAGTVLKQTVIQAVNQLQAIIVSNPATGGYQRAPIIGNGANGEGEVQTPSYITISGLTVTGGTTAPSSLGVSGISFAGSSSESCPGIIIENCEVYNFVNPNNSADIACIVFGTGPVGALVSNNLLHDCWTTGFSRTSHQNSSAIHDWGNNLTAQFNTIYGVTNAFYQKNQTATPPPGGMQILNNYIYQGAGTGLVMAGFNNANGSTPPYAGQAFKNNVVENTQMFYMENIGNLFLQSPTTIENNTFICTSVAGSGFENNTGMWVGPTSGAPWKFVTWLNNLIYYGSGISPNSEWGTVTFGPTAGDWTIIDYNRYPAAATFGIATNITTPPGSFSSLTTWKTLTGTPDTHSITTDPLMVFEQTAIDLGGGTAQYQLQSSSPCKATGQGGVNMGAWDGIVTQIGSNT